MPLASVRQLRANLSELVAPRSASSGGQAVDDKSGLSSWFVHSIPFIFAAILSAAGGAVRYLNNTVLGTATFKLTAFFVEIFISGFVGIVAYMVCDYANLSWDATAAVVAISGHMGVRALSVAEDVAISTLKSYVKGKTNGRKNEDDESEGA